LSIISGIVGWVGRHFLLFVLLVAAMVIYAQLRPAPGSTAGLRASVERLQGAEAELRAYVAGLEGRAVTLLDDGQRGSLRAIDMRLKLLGKQRAALVAREGSAVDMLRAPRAAIVADGRRRIDLAVIEQEIGFLEALRGAVSLDAGIAAKEARIRALDAAIAGDEANIRALPRGWSPDRYWRDGLRVRDLETVYRERQARNRDARAAAVRALEAQVAARRAFGDIRAQAVPALALAALEKELGPVSVAAEGQRERLAATIEGQARQWYQRLGVGKFLWPAFWTLVGIVLTPFAVRTLFYWVLAPLAALRKPITLVEAGRAVPVAGGGSGVSKAIRLAAGEELLVKQGYLQSPSDSGVKATQGLLDWRYPLMSLATGLWFLTRIRSDGSGEGGAHIVSAVRDPFAEIGLLVLPDGAACVIQPRAIAGVVQRTAARIRITSHWRLGTLNAWLTWQLRFLVFHGPGTVILHGGRGVRMEPVETGRSIGQNQLIGFSAGLSYSSRRTETFLPYLFGMEPLLRDRVATGSGLLIAEEAPMAGRRTGIGAGFEGAVEAFLKVFGI
jgi:hypothetical protein